MSAESHETLKEYLVEYVKTARANLKEKSSTGIDLFGCNYPCQISIVWFTNPTLQVIFFTHNKKISDLTIDVTGPYYSSDAINILNTFLEQSNHVQTYLRGIPDGDLEQINQALQDECVNIIRNIQQLIASGEPSNAIHRSTYMLPNATLWIIEGFLPSVSIDDLCKELGVSSHESDVSTPERSNGWGAFYYPPITFQKEETKSFEDKLVRRRIHYVSSEECTGYIGDIPIFIGKDGMIGVLCEDRENAYELINLIFSYSLIKGIECYPTRPQELFSLSFNWTSHMVDIIQRPSMDFTPRMTIFSDGFIEKNHPQFEREYIELEKVQNLIVQLNQIIDKPKTVKAIHFLHMAYHQLHNYEYNSAFTLTWTIIENWIMDKWESYLKQKRISKNTRERLLRWNIDSVINSIYLAEMIGEKKYNLLDGLRKKRNKIIHLGEFATKKDVEKNINTALNFLKDSLPTKKVSLPLKKKKTQKRQKKLMKIELVDDIK